MLNALHSTVPYVGDNAQQSANGTSFIPFITFGIDRPHPDIVLLPLKLPPLLGRHPSAAQPLGLLALLFPFLPPTRKFPACLCFTIQRGF